MRRKHLIGMLLPKEAEESSPGIVSRDVEDYRNRTVARAMTSSTKTETKRGDGDLHLHDVIYRRVVARLNKQGSVDRLLIRL